MRNVYIFLLALVYLAVGLIHAHATPIGKGVVGGAVATPTFSFTQTDVRCNDQSTGSITVTASGGTGGEYQYSKDNGATFQSGNQFTNLAAATYQVVVKDNTNTLSAAQAVTVGQPAPIEANVTSLTQTCPGLSTGLISVAAGGGVAPYQYSLDNGTTFQTGTLFTSLGVGSYPLAVKDANNCLVKPATYQMTSSVAPTITPEPTNVSCNGLQNGSIYVDLSGGADLGQSYASINNGVSYTTNFQFNALGVGVYQVVVKYGNNCLTPVQSVTLTQPAPLSFSAEITNTITCYGNTTGSILVTATGGTAPYQYSKDNGATFQEGNQFNELEAGTYAIVVQDANGCKAAPQSVTLTQPTEIKYTVAQTNVSCYESATGSFTITATGGVAPYRLLLNGNEYNDLQSPSLSAGEYSVAVGDASGCETNHFSLQITQPDPLSFEASSTGVSCSGGSTGQITVTVSGGTAPYQYSKDNGATFQAGDQFAGLAAGSYEILVKDANNCLTTAESVIVTQPSILSASITKTDVTSCFGGANGGITVTTEGGTSPYEYSKDNGATFQEGNTFGELGAGTYAIVVQDANNCVTASQSVTISQPTGVAFSTTKVDVTGCNGNITGSITVTATGGTAPYQYSKDNGATFQEGSQFNELGAGTYAIVVQDANGCTASPQSVIINQPAALSFSTAQTNVACFNGANGTITFTVTGGTGSYQYSINGGSGFQASNQFSGLAAGSYPVLIRDANGCSVEIPPVVITQPAAVTFSTTKADVVCFGGNSGSITVMAMGGTGGYQYSKDNGASFQASNQFVGLTAGTYPLIVKDANNCVSPAESVIINQPTSISLTVTQTNVTTCFGGTNGSLTLTATGGSQEYQYSKDNGQTFQAGSTFAELAAGTYTVLARDGNGCTTVGQTVVISQPTAVSFTTTKTDVNTCLGGNSGSITVSAAGGTGGYQYSKDNGATFQTANTFSALTAGTYSILVKDANTCTASPQTVLINQPTALTATVTSVTQTCPGLSTGAIRASASGGTGSYQYSLNGGTTYQTSDLFTSLPAGNYTLAVKDANGCVFSKTTYQVTAPTAPTVTPSVLSEVSCYGGNNGSIDVDLSGGTDLGEVLVSINNGSTFSNSLRFNSLVAGIYPVVVKYATGCLTPAQSVTITQPASALTVSVVAISPYYCASSPGSFTLAASGGRGEYQYIADGGGTNRTQVSPVFTDLLPFTYNVTVRDGVGCVSTAQVATIQAPRPLEITLSPTNALCNEQPNGTITVVAQYGTAPYQYSKNNGDVYQDSPQFTGLGAGNYTITVKDAKACPVSQTVTIGQPDALAIDVRSESVSCFGGTDGQLTITATGGTAPYQYSKNNGTSYQTGNQLTNLSAGVYQVMVKDANNCIAPVQSLTVTQPAALSVVSSKTDVTTCAGSTNGSISVTATGGTPAFQYSRDNGITYQVSSTFTDLPAGTYQIVVKDARNCTTSVQSVTINQPAVVTLTLSKTDVATCFGGSTGGIRITASGGTGAYQYSKDNGVTYQASNQFTGLTAGTYQIRVKDANDCASSSQSITINQPAELAFSVTKTNVICSGGNTGSISLSATGGTGAYQYSNTNGTSFQAGNQFTNLIGGTYAVVVKDANGCVAPVQSVTINQADQLRFSTTLTNVACYGTSTGSVSVTASGGTAPYQYSRNNGSSFQVSNQFTNLQAGTYSILVKDVNGCLSEAPPVQLTQPEALTVAAAKTDIVSCSSANTGVISLSATGGVGPYQYSINNGSTYQDEPNFTALPAGVYSIIVKDANNCQAQTTVTLTPACCLSVTASASTITNGQSTTLTASGCSGTVSWNGGPTNTTSYVVNPTQTTSYTATCTISGGSRCQNEITITVNQPNCGLEVAASPSTITAGQSSTLTATGCQGGTISWTGGPANSSIYVVSPSRTTAYTATCSIATSGNPVTCSLQTTVTVNPVCTLTTSASPSTITSGQSSTLTASGCVNGTVSWNSLERSGLSVVVSPSATTSYTATCTIQTSGDPVVCTSTVTVTVSQPVCSITTSASPSTITNGQSTTLTASGCIGAVSWVGSAQEGPLYVVAPTQTTTYTAVCSLSTSNTCTSTVTVTVNQPVCTLTTSASPSTITNGQSSTLTASGCVNGTVSWNSLERSGLSIVVSPSATTSYTATCTIPTSGNPVVCSSTVRVTVSQPVCTLTTSASPSTITNGQSTTLTASGCTGAVSWLGTAQAGPLYVVAPTQTTTYTAVCSLSTSNTCTSTVTVTVNQPVCTLTTSASPSTITNGQSTTLTASGCVNGTVSWNSLERSGLSVVVSPSATTSYTATCTIPTSGDPVVCQSVVTVTVRQPVCALTTSASPSTITNGQSSTLTASGCTGAVSWLGTAQEGPLYVVAPTQTTTYTAVCSLSTSNTCTSTVTVTVNQPVCNLITSASPSTITNGQSSTLTASGCVNGTVSWNSLERSGLSVVVSPSVTTSYTATCTIQTSGNPVVCTSTVTVTVSQPVCSITTSASPSTITNGQSTTLTASGCTGAVSWVGTAQEGLIYVINPTQTTTYTALCSLSTSNTCTSTVTVTVNQPVCTLTTSASPSTITNGQSTTLTASGCANGTLSWGGGPANASIYVVKPAQTTSYTATCTIPTSGNPVICSSVVTVTVNQPVCTIVVQANPATIFAGQSTTLTATGCANGAITWNSTPQTGGILIVNPNATTTYSASCTIPTSASPVICTAPFTVTVIARPVCNLGVQTSASTVFAGSPASLTAVGCGGSVNWSNGQAGSVITVSPATTASYTATCTLITAAGSVTCQGSTTVTVIARPVCSLSVQANPASVFNGQSTTLTTAGCDGGTIRWSTLQSGPSLVISPSLTTTYSATCTLTTAAGSVTCTAPVTVTVTQPILQVVGSSDIIPLNAATWVGTVTQNVRSFVWQYKTTGGDWLNFPTVFDNNATIAVSATSFLGSSAPAYVNQAIQLRTFSPVQTSNVLTVTIRQKPPTITALTTARTVCSGSSTGGFSLTLSRGLETGESAFLARVYTLTGGIEALVNSYTFTGTSFTAPGVFGKGTYRVHIQSIIGNKMSDMTMQDFSVDDTAPVRLSATATDVLCFNGQDGTINLVADGGVGPYQFSVNGGAFQAFQTSTQHQIRNVSVGTYSIRLRDGSACQTAQPVSVSITQPVTPLTISGGLVKNPTGFQVNDGTVTLTVTGGTPAYSFAWSVPNPQTSTVSANPGVTHTILSLGDGNYTVVITDANFVRATDKAGCTAQATYRLTQPNPIEAKVTIVKPISCARSADGIVQVDVTGGVPKASGDPYSYSWKIKSSGSVIAQSTNRLTNVASATYTVTVTDANGVSKEFDVFLAEPSPLVATLIKSTDNACFGTATGSASISIQGGVAPYTTRWNTQQTGLSLTNLQAGRYLAVVTDANACQAQLAVQIQQPQALSVTLTAVDPTCYDKCDGRIAASLAGGVAPYTVAWSNPISQQLSLTGLCSGTYSVSVSDGNGCATTQTAILKRPVQKQIVLPANGFICKGQTVDLDGTIADGTSYLWTYPDGTTRATPSISVTAAGNYRITATDKNACVTTAQLSLTASATQAPALAFAVLSQIGIGEPLIAVNITNPKPVKSSWTVPASASLISSTDDQVVLVFSTVGTYSISLNAQEGQCEVKATKMVTVVPASTVAPTVQNTPFIQELTIMPNPSSGNFKLRVVLAEISDVKIRVKPLLSTGIDIYQQSATGQKVYELSINIPDIQTGFYLLTLETDQAIQSTKLLISR